STGIRWQCCDGIGAGPRSSLTFAVSFAVSRARRQRLRSGVADRSGRHHGQLRCSLPDSLGDERHRHRSVVAGQSRSAGGGRRHMGWGASSVVRRILLYIHPMLNETGERFLKAILEHVPVERIVEIHLFPAIRQGQLETGVAVVAAEPPPTLELQLQSPRLEVHTAWYRLT